MLGTLHTHKEQGVDVSDLRLRATSIGKVRSKDAMNWQIDDLINFLQGWVRAGQLTQERAEEEEAKVDAQGWVCFRAVGNNSRIRRYNKAWPTTSICQRLVDGVWVRGDLTVADAVGLLESPEFYECNEEGEPLQQLKMTKPELKVMYYRHNSEGPIYRVTEGKCYVSLLLDSGEWREVITTAEKALARIALGEYFECDAEGAPIYRDVLGLLPPQSVPAPKAEEWVYFRDASSAPLRRYSKAWPTTSRCDVWVGDDWARSALSVKDAIELLKQPNVFECDEHGAALTKPAPKEKYCRGASGEVYRLLPGKEFADMWMGANWRESVTTVEYMLGEIATGRAVECDEPKPVKWVYFSLLADDGALRRYDANSDDNQTQYKTEEGHWLESVLTKKDAKIRIKCGTSVLTNVNGRPLVKPEARIVTDPKTGHQYQLHTNGDISRKHAEGCDFLPLYMTVKELEVVNRLGLAKSEPGDCEC
ncbi:MAG: hypothetical protein ACRDDI_13460 [Aeromonas veronii]